MQKNEAEIRPDKLDLSNGFRLHYTTLHGVIFGMEAKNVFEFGCGYSSKVILDVLRHTGGTLITNEMRDIKDTGNDQSLIDDHKDRWIYLQKRSDDALKNDIHGKKFDVVLHDGAHEPQIVMKDIRKIVKHMKQDALLLVHDTNHKAFPYLPWAVRLGLFPYRYEICTLPYGAGLSIIRLKSNLGNGKVELTWKKQ
jgi:predicted O-methyltransferase YrrM